MPDNMVQRARITRWHEDGSTETFVAENVEILFEGGLKYSEGEHTRSIPQHLIKTVQLLKA